MASGSVVLTVDGGPPRLSVQAEVADAALAGAALETAVDLTAGSINAKLDLTAAGYSPAALLATLAGSAEVSVRDGVAAGFDIPAIQAALADPDRRRIPAEAADALTTGASPFSRLDLPLQVQRGVLSGEGSLLSPSGRARLSGSIDLLGATADGRIVIWPAMPEPSGPELGLRIAGPAEALTRTPELAGLTLWLAERP